MSFHQGTLTKYTKRQSKCTPTYTPTPYKIMPQAQAAGSLQVVNYIKETRKMGYIAVT